MEYGGERIGSGAAEAVRQRRGSIDLPFAALTLLLLTIGVVMVLSASYARAYYSAATGHNAAYYFMRQLGFALAGVGAMYALSLFPMQFYRRMSFLVLAAAAGLLALVPVIGGAIAAMVFAYDMPLILIVLGLMYIIETLSDIIQVTYFKLSHGKRIFKMAPFHHHLEMGGWTGKKWTERELFVLYFSISLICAVISFVGVYNRYAF